MAARIAAAWLALLATAGVVWLANAAEKPSPRQRTEGLMATLLHVKRSPDKGRLNAKDKAANAKTFKALDDYFDFQYMTRQTIAPHVSAFSAQDMQRFHALFPELIRLVAYPKAGSFLRDSERTIGNGVHQGNRASVLMHVTRRSEDIEMEVTFYWEDQGVWRLVDVAFDGASLTKEYQNQLGRIIEKEGVGALLRKVQKRRDEEMKVLR